MKLTHPQIEKIIEVTQGTVNEIIIENQRLFSLIVEDIYCAINGINGDTVLSINNSPVDMIKYTQLITDFAPLQLNKKTLLTKITQILEKEALNELNYASTMELMSNVERYLNDLGMELPCEIIFNKMTVSNLIKAFAPDIVEEGKTAIEKLIDYMELVRELERDKLFVLVNMRSYFDDEIMEAFIQTALSHDHKILLLESLTRRKLQFTQRTTIDKDLCEF